MFHLSMEELQSVLRSEMAGDDLNEIPMAAKSLYQDHGRLLPGGDSERQWGG